LFEHKNIRDTLSSRYVRVSKNKFSHNICILSNAFFESNKLAQNISRKYIIIAADDMGRSSSVNVAVAEAHDKGIVTSASLMAGGEAFEEAVKIALKYRRLSVGLHVTLCDGKSVLKPSYIPDLVDQDSHFEKNPIKAWVSYMRTGILPQIEAEVEAQFNRLEQAGLHTTHVDGHHHLQMHPFIFEIICRQASKRGVGWIRVLNESLSIVLSLRSFSRGVMPFIERVVFGALNAYNLKIARKYDINVACHSLGLAWTGNIDEKCFLDLLDRAKGSIEEIFTHPDISTESGRQELEALTSAKVRSKLTSLGVELVGYRDLQKEGMTLDPARERM
jgi:hopanoid biosynthesis associated protein HpnK